MRVLVRPSTVGAVLMGASVFGCQFESIQQAGGNPDIGSAGSGSTTRVGPMSSSTTGNAEAGGSTSSASTSAVTTSATSDGSGSTGPGVVSESNGTTETSTSDPTSGAGSEETTSSGGGDEDTSTGDVAMLEVAGELLVSLDSTNGNASAMMWINEGTLDDFVASGEPEVGEVAGVVSVTFGSGIRYQSAEVAPSALVEPNATRTVEVWALNPNMVGRETLVSWSRHGDGAGRAVYYGYGSDNRFGVVDYHGNNSYRMGWNTDPANGQWHHIVYTFDGTTTRVYVDGELDDEEPVGAEGSDPHDDDLIMVGAQANNNGDPSRFLTGSIARVRVHTGVLDDMQVLTNFELESPTFSMPKMPK